jgi:hypothetical protein
MRPHDGIGMVGGNQMNLKSMSITQLTDLRHRVEAALAIKVWDSGGRSNRNSQNSVGCRALKRFEEVARAWTKGTGCAEIT